MGPLLRSALAVFATGLLVGHAAVASAQVARIGVLSPFVGPDRGFFEALRGR